MPVLHILYLSTINAKNPNIVSVPPDPADIPETNNPIHQ